MTICGIDEVGRGPLAGPVVASAVLLAKTHGIDGLGDSKKISETRRSLLEPLIKKHAIAYGLGWVKHTEIDRLNIHRATLLAMIRAVDSMLETLPGDYLLKDCIRIDGKFIPDFTSSANSNRIVSEDCKAIIKGDSLVEAISAASILAKVARDRWMTEYAIQEPQYNFQQHKGYPTLQHRKAIQEFGPSRIQRMSFAVRL